MAIYQRPDTTTIWAESGNITIPTTEKQEEGWTEEKPPSEMMNYIHNKQDKSTAYYLQEGIPEWDIDTEYSIGAIVKFSGITYQALLQNLAKQPDTNPSNWKIAFENYGAAAAVQADLDNIKNNDGALPFYVRKSDPVMTGKATAPSFSANSGLPASADTSNTGHSFINDGDSGMFKDGTDVVITSENRLVTRFPAATIPTTDSSLNVATTQWVKDVVNAAIEAVRFQFPIGWSIITNSSANPSTVLGYGTWELDLQGKALVGVSTSTSNAVPEWAKTVNQEFGEYTHTQTLEEMPKHKHRYAGSPDSDTDGTHTGVGGYVLSSKDIDSGIEMTGKCDNPAKLSDNFTIYPDDWAAEGNSQPFNVVQPSKTKYIWTRTG